MNLPRLRHWLALVVGCVIVAADARAHAFSDPESFGHKALAAGGEGR